MADAAIRTFLLVPVHQDAAVVFIDLSGFTALSETLGVEATQRVLIDFHALVDRDVEKHGGVITSFMGDGAMILFGLAESTPNDARNAALCCVDLCGSTEQWIKSLPPSIASRTGVKVGAHFGPIVASRLGGGSHQHITATGDTVNVASRLMEVAAKQGAALAVSDDLLAPERRRIAHCANLASSPGPRRRGSAAARVRFRSGSGATIQQRR